MKYIFYIILLAKSPLISEDIEHYILPVSSDSVELAVTYRFSSFELDYTQKDSFLVSKINFNLKLKDSSLVEWEHASTKNNDESIQVIGTKRIKVANTNLNLSLIYTFNGKQKNKKVKLKKVRTDLLALSDIIPCYVLERTTYSDSKYSPEFQFLNHNLIPNSSHEIAGGEKFLKFYYQILNLDKKQDEFTIKYEVLDAIERVKHREIYSNYSDTNKLFALSNYINLSDYPTGTYYLRVSLIDQQNGNEITTRDLKFFVVSKKKPELIAKFTEDELYERSLFATMTKEMVDREFRQTKIIMNEDQIDQFNQLSELKAQRRALYKFWSYRDPDPTTDFNENRDEFERAIQYSDIYYNEAIREGWNSDRGRILVKYGFPQQVDRYEQKAGKNATEVWFYGSQFGGLFFYFVEMSNNNDFRLVHSTHPGEMQNEYWVEEFNPAIDDSGVIERNHNYMRENGRR